MNFKQQMQVNEFANSKMVSLILNNNKGLLIDFNNKLWFETQTELDMLHKLLTKNGNTIIKTVSKDFYNKHKQLVFKLNYKKCLDPVDYANKCRLYVVEYFKKNASFFKGVK